MTDRRSFLRIAGAAGAFALAGCAANSSSSDAGGSGGSGGEATDGSGAETTASDAGGSGGSESSGGSEWTNTDTVEMTDGLAFEPKKIEVEKGTTVTWKNVGAVGHTITAYEDEIPEGAAYFASGDFDSQQAAKDGYPDEGNVKKGESYEHTFETKGEYKYYCIPHEMNGMVGYVKVV